MGAWSISRRISVGFALILACMACLSTLSTLSMQSILGVEKKHSQNQLPAAQLAVDFEREILNARINFIYFVTIQKPGSLEKGWERYHNAEHIQQALLAQIDRHEDLRDLRPGAAKLGEDLDAYKPALEAILNLVSSGVVRGPAYDDHIKDWASKGGVLVADASTVETVCANFSEASTQTITRTLKRGITREILICIAGIALCVFLAVLTVRQINRSLRAITHELHSGAEQIAGAAGELSSASQSLAENSSTQAASLEKTASVTKQISSSARRNSDTSRTAAQVLAVVTSHIQQGNTKLEAMIASMNEINQSSGNISKIIAVIDQIAFQTNILALNAAVEAARAGEAGLGFSVVAGEVRTLAQRSSEAARNTAGLIEDAMQKTTEGSHRLAEVNESMQLIIEQAAKFNALVESVNRNSQEQAAGLEQIAKPMAQMEQITQASAANAEQSAASSQELSTQAASLRTLVASLTALVEGPDTYPQPASHSRNTSTLHPEYAAKHPHPCPCACHSRSQSAAAFLLSFPKRSALPRVQAVTRRSLISASTFSSGSRKNAIQSSWSGIFATRCGPC